MDINDSGRQWGWMDIEKNPRPGQTVHDPLAWIESCRSGGPLPMRLSLALLPDRGGLFFWRQGACSFTVIRRPVITVIEMIFDHKRPTG
jgi:hypothetical protein